MTHYRKLKLYPILRWVSSDFPPNPFKLPLKYPIFRCDFPCYCNYSNVQHYSSLISTMNVNFEQNEGIQGSSTSNNGDTVRRFSKTIKKEAQGALLDYLHSTRSLPFLDAEHMSKNSPQFLRKLVDNVKNEPEIGRSVARFLRYHPINEFEPFFESIGLEPSEFVPQLPRDLMFLSDEEGLFDNYFVLCEYGVNRYHIGRIYRGAREVFRYGNGVLISKLREFEELGLSKPVIAKAVVFNPCLLIDGGGKEFFKVVVKLQCLGFAYEWVEQHLLENASYNWRQVFELLHMLNDIGCENEELGNLLRQHPELLFDRSGRLTFSLIGYLLKFGCTKNDICSLFIHFPQIKVGKFLQNLGRAFELFCELEMDALNIENIIQTHVMLLGSCSVKKANSLICNLNIGKKRLCEIIIENPLVLKNWVLRAKIKRLSETRMCPRKERIKFLSSIGFTEHSNEMEKALKLFRGKGDELWERFDCLVKAGLSEGDVAQMTKAAPQILNQSKEVIETKIRYLVNDLGYPVSSLKPFPGFIAYTMERVKLRFSMYNWLVNQNAVCSTLSLSTIIGCTDSFFVKKYVNKHPRGLDVWQELKKTIYVK
ncbi:transcription termination factor MTEF18, mitochondrial-like [Chenopodium quinoa]|uniref:transcription termination factor MTEF18, mitochondrial-like n=1 Tax=Chenopodium quinoa TaxID=63459 RepID=UPI000B77B87E|nr:transcription termination factor MTEF18, mitochondrial-like [Chenopodium quinoa]